MPDFPHSAGTVLKLKSNGARKPDRLLRCLPALPRLIERKLARRQRRGRGLSQVRRRQIQLPTSLESFRVPFLCLTRPDDSAGSRGSVCVFTGNLGFQQVRQEVRFFGIFVKGTRSEAFFTVVKLVFPPSSERQTFGFQQG